MARAPGSHIRNALTSILSPQLIRGMAARLGVVKRRRKVDVVALVSALVLGADRGATRSLASLRRTYELSTGTRLAASAFYDRFTPELAELMRQLTQRAFGELAEGTTKLKRALGAFAKVYIADGSVIRLHDVLEADYPSIWTNHMKASAKLHVVMNGATRTPELLRIVPGSQHDVTLLTVGPWCRGALLVFDLAYYQGKLFRKILDMGGHFLCRVKKDANFLITGADSNEWVGRRHRELLATMVGQTFEAEVDYAYRHIPERDYAYRHIPLRLIAVWNHDSRAHRLYLTTVSAEALPADTAAATYALRWEIELLFRELKTQLRLGDMPSGNKAATEVLLCASLLALAIGRKLLRAVNRGMVDVRRVLPPERWSALLRSAMPVLLEVLVGPPAARRALLRRLDAILGYEGSDPNRKRLLLPQRAEAGLIRAACSA